MVYKFLDVEWPKIIVKYLELSTSSIYSFSTSNKRVVQPRKRIDLTEVSLQLTNNKMILLFYFLTID